MGKNKNNSSTGFFWWIWSLIRFIFEKLSKLFDQILFHKTGSIIVSLLVSIGICVGIDYQDIQMNIFHDQTTSVALNDISVQTLIDDDTYDVSGIPDTVTVTLKGNSTDIQVYRKQGNIQVVADLRNYSQGENIIDLKVDNLPSQLEATVDPSTVTVDIEKKVTKTFKISSELLVSDDQKTSDFETPELSKSSAKITGSQEQIDSIRSVKAIVDASGKSNSFETEARLVAYDAQGATVDVSIQPETVHAKVSMKEKSSE